MNDKAIADLFLSLVQMDSHSLFEGRMAKRCKEELETVGFHVEFDDAGSQLQGETGNLIATLRGNADVPSVLLAAHMDTVEPGHGVRPYVDENGTVWSDGTTVLGADDKAGVTAILSAVREIVEKKLPHGQIQVLLTIAEEIGLQGSRHLNTSKLNSDMGLSLDSSGEMGTIAYAGPGQKKFKATVTGVRAHAGVAPEKGISAIKVAAHAVSAMPHGRVDDETTVNVGSFVGQGPTNIVPDKVTIVGEVRSRDEQKMINLVESIEEAFNFAARNAGASVEFDVEHMYQGFEHGEDAPVRKRTERALIETGLTPQPVKVGGGSDANVIQSYGLPILNIGVGYEDIHSTDEHIRLHDIVMATRVAVAFCTLSHD